MDPAEDLKHPGVMEQELRGEASRDYARDQEVVEDDAVHENWADCDVFDFDIARHDNSVPNPEDPPSPPTRAEIILEQRHDSFRQ